MPKQKKVIAPCIDVIGRKVTWKPDNSDRLYGEVIKVDAELYKPSKPLYEAQRFIRKFVTVCLNDGRVMRFNASQENIKQMGILADGNG